MTFTRSLLSSSGCEAVAGGDAAMPSAAFLSNKPNDAFSVLVGIFPPKYIVITRMKRVLTMTY